MTKNMTGNYIKPLYAEIKKECSRGDDLYHTLFLRKKCVSNKLSDADDLVKEGIKKFLAVKIMVSNEAVDSEMYSLISDEYITMLKLSNNPQLEEKLDELVSNRNMDASDALVMLNVMQDFPGLYDECCSFIDC